MKLARAPVPPKKELSEARARRKGGWGGIAARLRQRRTGIGEAPEPRASSEGRRG